MPYVFADPYGSNGSNANSGNGSGKVQADYAWNQAISKVTAPAYASGALMLPVAVDLETRPVRQPREEQQPVLRAQPVGRW